VRSLFTTSSWLPSSHLLPLYSQLDTFLQSVY
jgi:hypothetical protein